MTISIFEYGAHDPCSGEPLVDTLVRRRVTQAIANAYHSLGETGAISCFVVSNDDGTTAVRVRIGAASSGEDAGQGDILIAANSTRTFYVTRKRRTATETTDRLYINGVADS
jgi:hypothetical protein